MDKNYAELMKLTFNKKIFIYSFIVLALGWLGINYFLFTRKGIIAFHPDFQAAFLAWTWKAKTTKFVDIFGNYMPFFPYWVYLYGLFFDNYQDFIKQSYLFKSVIILLDVFTYAFILSIVKFDNKQKYILILLLTLINFSIYYNSVFWGQVDNIHTLFLLLGLYFILNRKLTPMVICVVLAISTKIVSVIFVPIFALILLNDFILKKIKVIDIIKMLGIGLGVLALVFLPIILIGSFTEYIDTQALSLKNYDCVSGNAYNIWYLLSNRTDLIGLSDKTPLFRNITYGQFGTTTFIMMYALVIFPLIKPIYHNIINKTQKELSIDSLLLVFILVPLVFFYFTTKIRERYAHPYLVFLCLYCFRNKKYIFWLFATFVYFLQLESVLAYTKQLGAFMNSFHNETNVYSPAFIAGLFIVLILYLLELSYRKIEG